MGFLNIESSDDMMLFSTSWTSPVMRAMMSPLRSSVKKPRGSCVIFSYTWLRMSRVIPVRMGITLDEAKKRMPAFATDRITSLGDIAMFTDSDDIPLWQVLKNLGEKAELKPCQLNYKKATPQELHDFFAEVLPDYDRERVHDSDIRKLIQWYDILVRYGITDFEATLAPTEGDNVDDRAEQ